MTQLTPSSAATVEHSDTDSNAHPTLTALVVLTGVFLSSLDHVVTLETLDYGRRRYRRVTTMMATTARASVTHQ